MKMKDSIDVELQTFGEENATLFLEAFDHQSVLLVKKLDKLIKKHVKKFESNS